MLRRIVRMEPAAGILSPRPFPRAAAPPAPPAGPGPPLRSVPGLEGESLAGPPAPDPGRLITDPCSGRTYFKGRLLGKVSWDGVSEGQGPCHPLIPRGAGQGPLSSDRGRLRARSSFPWSTLPDVPSS